MGLKPENCRYVLCLMLLLQLTGRQVAGQNICMGKPGAYLPHQSDCDKFYQCTVDETPVLEQCPGGLYWDQSILTCNFRDQVNCINDPCLTDMVIRVSCREYYPCSGGDGQSQCCPLGTSINVNTGNCVADASCTVPCNECQPVLSIDFDGSEVRDSKGNYVGNSGVTINNGKGYFDGNSFLTVPYFNDVPLAQFFEVSMRYKAAAGTISGTQALITNGDCRPSGRGSVEITVEETKTNYIMRNNNGVATRLARRTSRQHEFNRLLYLYADGKFRVRLNKANQPSKTKNSNGAIGKSRCDLKIGKGRLFNNFEGEIDFIKIWRCDRR